MTTAYTSLLGLALPVTGELSGTWGDEVNNSITQLIEDSVAGVSTFSVTSGDWTLSTTTNGLPNEARTAILIPTGTPGVSRNIIAPAKSKAYIVLNQSNAAVVLKGSATSGVTIPAAAEYLCAWNGSDFIKISENVAGSNTQVQFNNNGEFGGSANMTWNGTTLSVTGLANTGNTTLGDADTDTITQGASYVTGTQLKSAKTATNTLNLAAYDTDGAAYTNLVTLTASTTPTLALTSTGVGTMDNITVGGTTRAAGNFTNLDANGNVVMGDADTDTITANGQFVTGTQIKSAKVATNTLNLAAYDTDGLAYTNLVTLTASTTPTLALTSTGVGTINNMSIGATTRSTGAFTTLDANGNMTFGDADTDTITQAASYVTGTQLKSAKTATNTLNLAAYDTDGAAYTNLVTLTASTTPTLALTSTGTGTINNMSVGATTRSTGSFTTLLANADSSFTSTGALAISAGTTAQRPASPAVSMLRYNSSTNEFEGYSGASPAWKSVGGSAISNDTTTASNLYPLFAAAVTGTAQNVYTSNAQYLFKPSTGELTAKAMISSNGIAVTSNTVSTSYTIATGNSGMSVGSIAVADGVTVTISDGSVWAVV